MVTFYHLPAGKSQTDLLRQAPALFPSTAPARQQQKARYHVDAYLQHLDAVPALLVTKSSYWYSMWSHRRSEVWKGYVRVGMDSADDAAALIELDQLDQQTGHP